MARLETFALSEVDYCSAPPPPPMAMAIAQVNKLLFEKVIHYN